MKLDLVLDFILSEFLAGARPGDLGWDQPLISSGIIDSVGTMKLVLFLEETFGIEIEATDIASGRLDTLSSMAALLAEKANPAERATG